MTGLFTDRDVRTSETLAQAVARELLRHTHVKTVAGELRRVGMSEAEATEFIEHVQQALKSPEGRRQLASGYAVRMVVGLVMAVAGIILTFASLAGTPPGGSYLLFWGAILFGSILFGQGLVGWLRHS